MASTKKRDDDDDDDNDHHHTAMDTFGHAGDTVRHMTDNWLPYLAKPAVMLGVEFTGTAVLAFLVAASVGTVTTLGQPYTSIAAGLSYGLIILTLTALFISFSAGMFNPGATILTAAMWFLRLTRRAYIKKRHFPYVRKHAWVLDLLMLVLIIGVQVGGAFCGMLIVRHFQHDSAFVNVRDVQTHPTENFAGRPKPAFGMAIALNCITLTVFGLASAEKARQYKNHATEHTHSLIKKKLRQAAGALAMLGIMTVCVAVSYGFGTGSVLNFALDSAYGVGLTGETGHWWIWVVAQLIGALVAVVLIAFFQWVMHYAKPEKDPHNHHHGGVAHAHIPLAHADDNI